MPRQKIRIRLKAYDHRILDQSAEQIVEAAERTGGAVAGAVVQIKTKAKDGYDAIQLGVGTRKRLNDPMKGHMKRLGQFRYLQEVRVDDATQYEGGQKLGAGGFGG